MEILIGTKNMHKYQEFLSIFKQENLNANLKSLNDINKQVLDPIEDGNCFKENAIIKAKYYYEVCKMPVIADDSGLCVDALNGAPGIYSARYASDETISPTSFDNRKKLLRNLQNIKSRSAHFTCAIAYYDGKNLVVVEEYFYGSISEKEKGNNGFGYDSIFIPSGLDLTLSEMSEGEKNKISHRYKAIISLVQRLKKLD